ncbi:MAG: hemolysin family protein [Paracoccaceae bacterium]
MFLEIGIVLVLTLLNGFLAMSELAVVSARPARLRVMADQGSSGAATALRLAENPGRFLSSVQIGITLVGVLSGAFSGATLGARLASALPGLGVPPSLAHPLGVGGVVVAITYLSLIVGELVPKQIALSAPEAIAARVAPLMRGISVVAAPLVLLLDVSGRALLWLLGQSGRKESGVTDEEIRMLIAEAEGAGVMEKAETEMIAGVMRIGDRTARGLMTPRHDVSLVDVGETRAQIVARFLDSGHSRLPLRDGGEEEIVGVIRASDLLRAPDRGFDPRSVLLPAPVIHDSLPALEVIDRLREAPAHMLLVYDEYGHFEGIITPNDILGAITGGFDTDDEPRLVQRDDGSLLVSGWMPADEFAARIGVNLKDDRDYETVAGLILDLAGHLPGLGDKVRFHGWTMEVIDLDGRRIDKVLVQPPET